MPSEDRGPPMRVRERSRDRLTMEGERLVPTFREQAPGTSEYAAHVDRYAFAALHSRGVVLDIACGTGYGSRYLLEAGSDLVVGVDLSVEAVRHAVAHFGGPRFVVADGQVLPFQRSAFSSVVCLETIEHVADPDALLHEIRRVLTPGGRLVLSTPNYRGGRYLSPFHVREFGHDELQALVANAFGSEIRWFGQLVAQQPRLPSKLLRSIVDMVIDLDRFNVRARLIPYGIRQSLLQRSLGTLHQPSQVSEWHPACLYQLAVVQTRA